MRHLLIATLGMLLGAFLLGCTVTPEERDATIRAWAERDQERAKECARNRGGWDPNVGCVRGGGP